MFSDMLLLKTQLFHTVWPAVDIMPLASYANTTTGMDASAGPGGSNNYYPVSSESSVSLESARRTCCGTIVSLPSVACTVVQMLWHICIHILCFPGARLREHASANTGGLELRRQLRWLRQLHVDQRRQLVDCWLGENPAPHILVSA